VKLLGQAEQVTAWLGNCAYYHLSKTDVDAGEHCQVGGKLHVRLITYNWLDELFSKQALSGELDPSKYVICSPFM